MRSVSLLLLLGLLTTASCGGVGKLVYQHGSTISKAYMDTSPTPTEIISEEHSLYRIGSGWNTTALAISPSGQYAAVGLWTTPGGSRNAEGKIIVLDVPNRRTMWEYGKADLIRETGFPEPQAGMTILDIRWMNGDEMLVDMQPFAPWKELLPQNIAMIIDVTTRETKRLELYSPHDPSPIDAPIHATHSQYPHRLVSGTVHIKDQGVVGLRSGISRYGVWFAP